MHAHQFWWACPLWFRRYCYLQKRPNFPFDPWTIVIGVGKGGAEGAKAPPTLKLEGLSPPNFMLDGRLVVVNR